MTKQAVSQLIDTLVRARLPGPEFSMPGTVVGSTSSSPNGRRVAEAVMCGVELVDAQLNRTGGTQSR